MKLVSLLGLLLPSVYGVSLTYPTNIATFTSSWTNPDKTGTASQNGAAHDGSLFTDGDTSTGENLAWPGNARVWGSDSTTTTKGMVGTFEASTLNPLTGMKAWSITSASISFSGCFAADATAEAFYYDLAGNRNILGSVTVSSAGGVYTFTAPIPAAGVATNGAVGFTVTSGQYCEGGIDLVEWALEGVGIATDPPTFSPTTKTPTMAPTKNCKGEITWGDPHFTLVSMDKSKTRQFNYQGLGWHYYIFPCDADLYTSWPFFFESYHERCFWNGNKKGCVSNNRLTINTKPNPWVITFTNKGVDVTVGSDVVHSVGDFNGLNYKQYRERNPYVIEYNDGQTENQYGEIRIFSDSGDAVVQLHDVGFRGYPRTCDRGTKSGAACGDYTCDGEAIDIRNQNKWTVFSCPTCLRNIACGLMGHYTRGDCTTAMMKDPNSACYNVLQKSDGGSVTPAVGDSNFNTFAKTWKRSYVNNYLAGQGITAISFLEGREAEIPDESHPMTPDLEGKDVEIYDASQYDGLCKDDMAKISQVNDTCRAATVVKYAECCAQIGMGLCEILQSACVMDFCSCTEPNANATAAGYNDARCLAEITQDLNSTCNLKRLYPTATPTAAPTRSPTGLVSGLPKGQSAADLIWLYLIFVVLFVLIAGGAYWYYRKKNKGVATFNQEEEDGDMENPTYVHT